MAYRTFSIPLAEPASAVEQLNQFLAGHQIADVDRQFHAHGPQAYWHFCVNYVPQKPANGAGQPVSGRVDYRERLEEEDFTVFAKLRVLRKQIAEEKSLPVFAVFTNEQLAEMARRRVTTLKELGEIAGIGEKKLAAYGERFLEVLQAHPRPAPKAADERTPPAAPRELF